MGISIWQIIFAAALGVLLWMAFSRRSSRAVAAKGVEIYHCGKKGDIDGAVMEPGVSNNGEKKASMAMNFLQDDTTVNRSSHPPSTPDERDIEQIIEGVERIVRDYGAYLESRNDEAGLIWDVSALPYDKQIILDAICLAIMAETDADQINHLQVGAMFLADHQEGVGNTPISAIGADFSALQGANSRGELVDLAAKIASNPDRGRYESLRPLVEKDRSNILNRVQEAEQQRYKADE